MSTFTPALLLTVDLDEAATAYFEERRRRFFPAGLNRVPAHVMLFHRLPLDRHAEVVAELRRVSAEFTRFSVTVLAPYSMGTGVSYALDSAELLRLRKRLATAWKEVLIPQDCESYRPHVVVQNKVDADAVKMTLATIMGEARPDRVHATGMTLWVYESGFWIDPERFAFES